MKKYIITLLILFPTLSFASIPVSDKNSFYGITLNPINDELVAAGDNGNIAYNNGSGWLDNSSFQSINWRGIASSSDGFDVAVGHGAIVYAELDSNGVPSTWQKASVVGAGPATSFYKVVSGTDALGNSHFLAIGDAPAGSSGRALYDADTNNIDAWSRVANNIVGPNGDPNVVSVVAGNNSFMALDAEGYSWTSTDAINWHKISRQICNLTNYTKPQMVAGNYGFYIFCVDQQTNTNMLALEAYSFDSNTFVDNPLIFNNKYEAGNTYTMAFQDKSATLPGVVTVLSFDNNGQPHEIFGGVEKLNNPADISSGFIVENGLNGYNIEKVISGVSYPNQDGTNGLVFVGTGNKVLRMSMVNHNVTSVSYQ